MNERMSSEEMIGYIVRLLYMADQKALRNIYHFVMNIL